MHLFIFVNNVTLSPKIIIRKGVLQKNANSIIARQRAMHAERDIVYGKSVRTSVRLSVHPMLVLFLNELTYPHTFWLSGRGIILIFGASAPLRRWESFAIISETVREVAHGYYGSLLGSHRCSRSIQVGSSDLEWPWKAGHGGHNFLEDIHNYAGTSNDWMWHIESGWQLGEKHLFRRSATSLS